MHVPAHAELELLSDIQLGRALVHHQYMPELPARYVQHPDTADASQAVTVVAKAILKIKGFVYLLADIIGPATLLQDNLAQLHVLIRSGNTPRTKHPYTIRNHYNLQSHGRPSITLNSKRKLPQQSSNKCYQYILPCRIPYPSETQLVTKCG